MWVRLTAVLAICGLIGVQGSQELMQKMAINFAKPLAACKQEMNLDDAVAQEFSDFWKEGYELTNRQTGCAIMCISSKLELLDADLNLHHGKATEFALKHGADDSKAKQLIDLIHNCIQSTPQVAGDPCMTTLHVAKCFKMEIHKLNWNPSPELIAAEILAEG